MDEQKEKVRLIKLIAELLDRHDMKPLNDSDFNTLYDLPLEELTQATRDINNQLELSN